MKAIRFYEFGGPEVLKLEEVEAPQPRPGQVLIKVEAAGVNYVDVARRKGIYLEQIPLPSIPGAEVAGTVVKLGDGVNSVKEGTRVVGLAGGRGYAEYIALSATSLASIPRGLDAVQAAAIPLQGLTAYHILKTSARLQAGESVLVHAAAGGMGLFSVQLAKVMGAGKIIATASTQEKLDLALSLGADVGVNYTEEGWPEKVRELTNGKGVNVILEMVGGKNFAQNFQCLAPFGRVIVFGVASGQPAQLNSADLMLKCQAVIGFHLRQVSTRPEIMNPSMTELLNYIVSGRVKLLVNHVFPLDEAAEAHRQMENRQTMGKIVLKP
ncbi:MAG: quinone oxidoreductase [Chloroflexota bacterium]